MEDKLPHLQPVLERIKPLVLFSLDLCVCVSVCPDQEKSCRMEEENRINHNQYDREISRKTGHKLNHGFPKALFCGLSNKTLRPCDANALC